VFAGQRSITLLALKIADKAERVEIIAAMASPRIAPQIIAFIAIMNANP
jgi:hypothetical protein